MKNTLVLTILDGFGIGPKEGNAIKAAHTPNLDSLFKNNPTTKIGASGLSVGLPEGQMGNSEVGHTNIGAGRVVYQDLTRITKSIKNKSFFKNPEFIDAVENVKKEKSSLHIMGLLSDGGVHSTIDHLFPILELCKQHKVSNVFIHAILDGRDTSPTSGKKFIKECERNINKIGIGKIATVVGRYFAMDRDNRWDRTQKAYNAFVNRVGTKSTSAYDAVVKSYESNVTDEFIRPIIIEDTPGISSKDSVIFFNFRPDRARQITRSFVDPEFDKFERKFITPLNFVCMTQYDATLPNVSIAFEPESLKNTFGEYISKNGLTQLRIAETEKYAHVTFFFNAGLETPYTGEERILVHSPKVATYDLKPEMSAYEVADKVQERIRSGELDVVILNFANCDMVGHTGDFDATVKAVEAVDDCIKKVYDAVLSVNGTMIITADHGNAEKMIDSDGSPFTAHTTNLVPLCLIGTDYSLRENGSLCDIAPTMLEILGLPKPSEMTGESLLSKNIT